MRGVMWLTLAALLAGTWGHAESLLSPPGCRAAEGAKAAQGNWADRIVHEKSGMEMVFIPAGIFTMGTSDSKASGDMKFRREVVVRSPFYMGRTEVTNGQYRRFLAGTKYDGAGDTDRVYDVHLLHFCGKSIMSAEDDYPIVWVSWKNAQAFCDWAGLALPTEAQWEYACRAGSTTNFYFGDDEKQCDEYGWLLSSKEYHTHPVGKKLPNAWGLYDTIGNVWEWVRDDYFESYEGAPHDESPRLAGRLTKVLRGGSWGNPGVMRVSGSAARFNVAPTDASGEIGFRAAIEFDAPEALRVRGGDLTLAARYDFEEGGGEVVRDSSGRGNDGKSAGATYVKLGEGKGWALSFETPEALVDCGDAAGLKLGSGVTLEYWLYAKTKPAKGEVGIVGKGFDSYLMSFGGRCWFYIDGGKNHVFADVPLGEWHHITATYDRDVMRLYVDGAPVGERRLGYPIAQGKNFYLRCPLPGDAKVEGTFTFMLDDVRVYNRALSAEEVASDYSKEMKEKVE
ncbi:MAG: SUMF1/EgtB/PvdO family nonheme iron enzyme [Planctomycetota bacterium]